MAKVKKSAGLTGERNVKRAKALVGGKRATTTSARAGSTKRGTGKKRGTTMAANSAGRAGRQITTNTQRARRGMVRSRAKPEKPAPVVTVAVKELDPQRKCGVGTSVQFLYRVDESVEGRSTPHLVFFDRHGWYCEHGRACPAVMHARKYNGQIARVS